MNEHAVPTKRRATYQDVLDAPPNMVAELIRGALYTHPRPASRHALASSSLGDEIVGPFQKGRGGPGGWWIIDEPELHLGPDVLVPDLAGWRRERMPAFPDAPWFDLAPDWVCEVLSPGTRRFDLTDKRDLYGAAGIGHLWLIDPAARLLEAFALEGRWVLIGALIDDAEVRLPPVRRRRLPARDPLGGLRPAPGGHLGALCAPRPDPLARRPCRSARGVPPGQPICRRTDRPGRRERGRS